MLTFDSKCKVACEACVKAIVVMAKSTMRSLGQVCVVKDIGFELSSVDGGQG